MRIYEKDKDYHRLLGSRTWLTTRARYLSKHPICEECERRDITRLAAEVHHITPLSKFRTYEDKRRAAYDEKNLMALCFECHHAIHNKSYSTRLENKRAAEKTVTDFASAWLGLDISEGLDK